MQNAPVRTTAGLWLPFALLIVVSLTAFAQRTVRVSPPDPVSYPVYDSLPKNFQVQSAARIGNRTFVVWGTTVTAANGEVIPALVGQIVIDGVPADPLRLLTSDSSRPNRGVSVLAYGDRFALFYDEFGPFRQGFYLRYYDLDGAPMGEPMKIGIYGAFPGTTRMIRHANRGTVVWENGAGFTLMVYMRRLDSNGIPIVEEEWGRNGSGPNIVANDSLPGSTIVLPSPDRGWAHLVHANGRIDERTIQPRHVGRSWRIGADSSLVTLGDSGTATVRLDFHRSIFDEIPYRHLVLRLSSPASGPGGPDIFSDLAVVTRDSIGRTAIVWPVGVGDGRRYTVFIVRGVLVADTLAEITVLGTYVAEGGPVGRIEFTPIETSRRLLCNNHHSVRMVLRSESDSVFRFDTARFAFEVDDRGRVTIHPGAREIPGCADGSPVPVVRVDIDTFSSVRIDTLTLRHRRSTKPTTVTIPPADESQPNLMLDRNGELWTIWETWRENTWREYSPHSIVMGQWNGRDTATIEQIVPWPLSGSTIGSVSYGSLNLLESGEASLGIRLRTEATLDKASGEWTIVDRIEGFRIPDGSGPIVYDTLTRHGLRPKWGMSIDDYAYDPNSRRFYFSWRQSGDSTDTSPMRTMIFVDENGGPSTGWRFEGTNEQFHRIVPIADSTWLMVTLNGAVRMVGGAPAGGFTFATAAYGGEVRRLLGDRFLRNPRLIDGRGLLELFDLEGRLLAVDSLPEVTSYYPYVIQRRSDSSIVILWSENGIYMSMYDRNLRPIVRRARIAEPGSGKSNPAGAIRNDTLFVVWEDERDGKHRHIYGTAVALDKIVSGIGGSGQDFEPGIRIGNLAPNPATGDVTLTYETTGSEEVTIELVDPLGRRVGSLNGPAGMEQSARIDLNGLSSGIYIVVLRAGDRFEARTVVVAR